LIVLGIDPGTSRCGYGVIEVKGSAMRSVEHGLLKVSKGGSASHNLLFLKNSLTKLIDKYKPEILGVEKLFFNKNVKTALAVGEARGVILLAGAEANLKIVEFTPQQIKIALTGYGRADKSQVGRMVSVLLGLDSIPKPDDVADALAVAISASRAGISNWGEIL